MKGHAKFELKNINTGEIEAIEEDNLITNALNYYFANCGLTNIPDAESPLYKTLLGGILLLDTAIEENPDIVFPPAGVRMVGNGAAGYAFNDEVTECGSYNSAESSFESWIDNDGIEHWRYKQVYDFASNQANGKIACCCLTSNNYGYIGHGNASGIAHEAIDYLKYYGTCQVYTANNNGGQFIFYDDITATAYFLEPNQINYASSESAYWVANSKKLKFRKRRLPVNELTISNSLYTAKTSGYLEIDIPEEFCAALGTSYTVTRIAYDSDGNCYVSFMQSNYYGIAADSHFYILKINKDFSIEWFDIVNTAGKLLQFYRETIYFIGVDNGKAYFSGRKESNSYIITQYSFNLSNSECIDYGEEKIMPLNPFMKKGVWIGEGCIFDTSTDSSFKINGGKAYGGRYKRVYAPNNPLMLIMCFDDNNSRIGIYRDINYIATINNLQTPIVKTAEKTLKVTYTVEN